MSIVQDMVRSGLLELQKRFPVFPSAFCLVTGAPRSGTGAMASWLGHQPRVKGFSESKVLFIAHQLRQSFRKWERFPKDLAIRHVREFVLSCYAETGVYLGSRMLLDKEPLDPLSLSSDQYDAFIASVEEIFPSVRFVVMVRNPESMVSSVVNRNWGYSIQGKDPAARDVKDGINIWLKANRLVASISQKDNVHICEFEDLVSKPHEESRKIAQFLSLRHWKPFRPRETSEITLEPAQRRQVWEETAECRRKLQETGIHYTPKSVSTPRTDE